MNTAKVRNWHKRNTRAANQQIVTVAVHSQDDPRWEPYAQIMLRSESAGVMTITMTPAELLALKDQICRAAQIFEQLAADEAEPLTQQWYADGEMAAAESAAYDEEHGNVF